MIVTVLLVQDVQVLLHPVDLLHQLFYAALVASLSIHQSFKTALDGFSWLFRMDAQIDQDGIVSLLVINIFGVFKAET